MVSSTVSWASPWVSPPTVKRDNVRKSSDLILGRDGRVQESLHGKNELAKLVDCLPYLAQRGEVPIHQYRCALQKPNPKRVIGLVNETRVAQKD
jgi:hypothetical protein